MEDPHPAQDLQRNGRGDRFDGLMDAGVRTNEDMGRRGALQAARWETNKEFGWVIGQRKVAHADSARELAEWGGCAGNGQTCSTWSDWAGLGRTGDWWDLGV